MSDRLQAEENTSLFV